MGLGGFFRRLFGRPAEGSSSLGAAASGVHPRPIAPPLAGGHAGPRDQHYLFAHRVVRDIFFKDPLSFLAFLASPEGPGKLRGLWDAIGEDCAKQSGTPALSADGLRVHTVRIAGYPAAVIELPEPRGITEAHFVAAILLVDPAAERLPEKPSARYLTLEKGFHLEGGERTVLCEWAAEAHLNYGDGPPAELDAFCNCAAEHLK